MENSSTKIIIISKRLHTNLYYRAKALLDAGHQVKVLVWYKGASERYDGIEPIVIGYSWLGRLFNKIYLKKSLKILTNIPFLNLTELINFKKLKQELKKEKADVILVRGYSNWTFFRMIYCARQFSDNVYLLAQLNKHYAETLKKKIFLFFLKKVLKVKGIITPLQNTLPQTNSYFKYLPFVYPVSDFEKTYFKNGRINIVSIGKFMKRKDHLLLLEAINNLKDKYKIFLTIIGEKTDNYIFEQIKDYIRINDMADMVDLKFNLPHDKVLSVYREQDLFVLPSFNEPAAFSPLEAMGAKLPVILSDTSGTKCYIKEGENGYIFESKNLNSLVDKIELIINNKDKLIAMGEKSFAMTKEFHSPQGFVDKIANIENL